MRKIIFSVLITMTVLAVSMPSIAQTATVNGIIYRYDTASLTATLIDGKSCSGAVDIPVEINVTYKDSQNRPCASKFSVLYIGDSAFDGCTALTSVTIPASVRSIGAFAFHGCTGLTSIVTGISVSSIGDSAFRGCTGLTSITFEERVATIGSQAFYGCAGLTAVDIPETVTSIGASAFEACENLKRVNISDLTAWCNIDMGESVFPDYSLYLGNTLLSYMDIPDGVTAIKEYAFYRCTGLISVTMPKSVTSVGNFAFAYCKNLKISVSDLTAWCNIDFGYFAFPDYILYLGRDQITDLIIPDGVTAIKQNTFYNCTGITSVTLHNSVAKIGESAFQGCTGLTSMTIPESVKAIGNSAFEGCENLTKVHISDLKAWCNIDFGYSVFPDYSLYLGNTLVTDPVIPDGLTEIKKYVFSHCTSIASVKIPETVTSISSEPFYRCTGLKEVTIPNSVTSIGWGHSPDATT